MEHLPYPNLLLESLAYCGRKVSGNTWEHMENRLKQRKADISPAFFSSFTELRAITSRIDKAILGLKPKFDEYSFLFQNLEGFPFNTIGSCSPAFLLYYPMLALFEEDPDTISASEPTCLHDWRTTNSDHEPKVHDMMSTVVDAICSLTPEQILQNILETLDIATDMPEQTPVSGSSLVNTVISLSVPDASKMSILRIYTNYAALACQAAEILTPLLEAMEAELPAFLSLTAPFSDKIGELSEEEFFGHLTHLTPTGRMRCSVRPFIFGPDTILTANENEGSTDIYCGFLREELLQIVSEQPSAADTVYSCYRLLGDRSRFDILCFLRDHSAYGQELSEHFGLSRNTIHHHMNKLISSGLVNCTVNGNRVYYSINHDAIDDFLRLQKELY